MLKFSHLKLRDERTLKKEAKASQHINIMGHYDASTLIDKNGHLIKLFTLEGLDPTTQSQLELDMYKRRRNSVLKTFNANVALYSWTIRQRTTDYPEGHFKDHFSHTLNEKYRTAVQSRALFQNKIYFALIVKIPKLNFTKFHHWFKNLFLHENKRQTDHLYQALSAQLEQHTEKLLSTFSVYNIKPLTVTTETKPRYYSEPLAFISYLLNLEHDNVPIVINDMSSFLPKKRLFFNAKLGTIEIRGMDNSKRFGAILSLKNYADSTFAGILDHLQTLPIEFILTQSYRFIDSHIAKKKVRDQQSDFRQIQDESLTQTEQLSESLDDAASGEVGFGLHHLTLLCLADDPHTLNRHVAEMIAAFSKNDMVCVRETLCTELGFWAQLPANFAYIARESAISTKNLAGFMSFHNPVCGQLKNNYWGDAVTVLETVTGNPHYFNFHYKDVGNTLCLGSMGSGKTTLIGFLLAQSLKFGGKRVVFDKDRGLEILVRALGGYYEILTPGIATGFNPCQLEDSPENRSFLFGLFKKILTTYDHAFSEQDADVIHKVITRLYSLPLHDRTLQHIAPFFGTKTKGSLRARFDEWHSDGAYAWLFDNQDDQLNLDPDVIGFELGQIFDHSACRTPALMYLTYRVGQALEGQRGGIFMDEVWRALDDSFFREEINHYGRTPRKKNNFLVLATQSAEDVANTAICKAFNQSASCKFFFPNPQASRETYIDALGLSEHEYNCIKTMDMEEHYFLLNFGRGKESVVARANLSGLDDEIAIISGRESTVQLLDHIRRECGDNPKQWLSLFHERRKTLCLK